MLVVIAAAAGLGVLLGLGTATVLAALPAMFCLMAAFGGTRYADLRLLCWFGPVLVVVVGGLKTLAGLVQWPAIVLVTLIVFVAGMLPALGTRMITVGMGLGMASTFAYGFQLTGPPSAAHDFAAPAVSVAVVVVTRALLGAGDPDGPLRAALSAALTSDGSAAREQAYRQWQADGPRAWTTAALGGVLRYANSVRVLRTRRPMLTGDALAELDAALAAAADEAALLGAEIAAKPSSAPGTRVRGREAHHQLPGATAQLLTSMWLGLEAARAASIDRDRGRVDMPSYVAREPLDTLLRGALTWRSAQLRHAVRCALGMLVAMLVSLLFASSPLRLSFLMAVFAIMQPQLQDTIVKARQRVVGALAGAAALALLIVLVQIPDPALVPIGVVALLVGFLFFMQRNPVVFNACVVLMSVGMNVNMRHLQLRQTLLDYLLLMALAVLIALVFGFVAVPGVPKVSLAQRFDEALRDSREMLAEVASGLVRRDVTVRALRPAFRAAAGSHQNLRAVDAVSPTPSDDQSAAASRAADALQGLSASATALIMRPAASTALAGAVGEVAHQLGGPANPAAVFGRLPAVIDQEQQLLLDTMIANTSALSEAATTLR